jgi:Leucine-rich repeat (LRR) protein
MTYLTDLDLANNAICSIPPSIRAMGGSLTALDLSYNRLCSIPLDLRFLTKLDVFGTAGMDMDFLPSAVRQAGVRHMLRFISSVQDAQRSGSLTLDNMNLSEVPEDVIGMTNLTELRLDHNQIGHVPGELTMLRGLKTFSIEHNNIRTIPTDFERFPRLERISLLGCPIEELPLGLCKMTSLTEIKSYSHDLFPKPPAPKISSDQLIENTFNLLDTFEHMMKAYETRRLILADMALAFFPNEAFQISTLTDLDISLNNFDTVPNIIGGLVNLINLRISYNFVTNFGFSWAAMTALKVRSSPQFSGTTAARENGRLLQKIVT